MWVRLPPRALSFFLMQKELHARFLRVPPVYPTCLVRSAVRARQKEWVLLPRAHHSCFERRWWTGLLGHLRTSSDVRFPTLAVDPARQQLPSTGLAESP